MILSNGGQDDQGTWNQTCQETAAGIAQLADILYRDNQ